MFKTWTFGIITDGSDMPRLEQCINSAYRNSSPGEHIIVVGGTKKPQGNVIWIPFDETIKDKWITKKKNLIAQLADSAAICFMHDYVSLEQTWRIGMDQIGWPDFTHPTCTNKILNGNGKRFRDWCVIYNDAWMNPPIDDQKPPENIDGHLLQYDNFNMGRWQYMSGAYFCATKYVMMHHPLNEERVWGQGEDVEWCRKVYATYGNNAFLFNPFSEVRFLKIKEQAPWEMFSPL